MKRIFISAAAALYIMLLMAAMPVTAFAENTAEGFDGDVSSCGVYDRKGILSLDQQIELNELVQETSEELGLYIMIYLSDTARSEWNTKDFSDCTYEDYFGPDTDGVFYYMDLSEQYSAYDYISTSGIGNLYYDGNTDDMLDVIFDYLPASGETIYGEDIEKGIRVILQQFEKYAEEPGYFDYYHDSDKGTYTYYRDGQVYIGTKKPAVIILRGFLIAGIPAGIIVFLIVYFSVKRHYKFKPSFNPTTYVTGEKTRFTEKNDVFLRTHTTKTKIESSSSGGGHGGGHSSGSHGGGGGHR